MGSYRMASLRANSWVLRGPSLFSLWRGCEVGLVIQGGARLWEEAPDGCGWASSRRVAWLLPRARARASLAACCRHSLLDTAFLPFSEPALMPALKGLLEVSIQGLSGQWVSLEGCPCPDQTVGPIPCCSLHLHYDTAPHSGYLSSLP